MSIWNDKKWCYNLGIKIVNKLTKISKICVSVECFIADIPRFFSANVKTCLLGGRLGTRHQIQAFQEFSRNFICGQNVISKKLQRNFIEVSLRHGCSPVILIHIFRTVSPKNTSRGLFQLILNWAGSCLGFALLNSKFYWI